MKNKGNDTTSIDELREHLKHAILELTEEQAAYVWEKVKDEIKIEQQ